MYRQLWKIYPFYAPNCKINWCACNIFDVFLCFKPFAWWTFDSLMKTKNCETKTLLNKIDDWTNQLQATTVFYLKLIDEKLMEFAFILDSLTNPNHLNNVALSNYHTYSYHIQHNFHSCVEHWLLENAARPFEIDTIGKILSHSFLFPVNSIEYVTFQI